MCHVVGGVEKYVDGSGRVIEPEIRYSTGAVRWVLDILSPDYAGDYHLVYECTIKPRSWKSAALVGSIEF